MSEDLSALTDEDLKAGCQAALEIKPGSVVMLRSGGPHMMIEAVSDCLAKAVWFDGARLCSSDFTLNFLIPVEQGLSAIDREICDRISRKRAETGRGYRDLFADWFPTRRERINAFEGRM